MVLEHPKATYLESQGSSQRRLETNPDSRFHKYASQSSMYLAASSTHVNSKGDVNIVRRKSAKNLAHSRRMTRTSMHHL